MTDPCLALVLPYLQAPTVETLWVADENTLGGTNLAGDARLLHCITNRFDIFQEINGVGVSVEFSDYDFTATPDESVDRFVYRVSKERAVVHHVINNALRCLKPHGELILVGEKTDGIKGYSDKAGKLFGVKVNAKKHGVSYCAKISKNISFEQQRDSNRLLDDKSYSSLRATASLDVDGEALAFYSKPGQFGWNKQDQGSELLIKAAEQYLSQREPPQSLLDLGCGYGFLMLKTKHWNVVDRVATDNNAAALASAEKNFSAAALKVSVIADDCGKDIKPSFECVLCNPPFHQGFSNDSSLTKKFLSNAARLTQKNGVALFVVNQFIPLEKLATDYFSHSQLLDSDGQFNVVALRHNAS